MTDTTNVTEIPESNSLMIGYYVRVELTGASDEPWFGACAAFDEIGITLTDARLDSQSEDAAFAFCFIPWHNVANVTTTVE